MASGAAAAGALHGSRDVQAQEARFEDEACSNPFDADCTGEAEDEEEAAGANPFDDAWSDPADEEGADDSIGPTNPFQLDCEDPADEEGADDGASPANPFQLDCDGSSDEAGAAAPSPGDGAAAGALLPEGGAAIGAPRPTLPARPRGLLEECAAAGPPPAPSLTPGGAQEPAPPAPAVPEELRGLKACLPLAVPGLPRGLGLPRPPAASEPEIDKALSARDMEAALAACDAALYEACLREGAGYQSWEWRDCEAEERHDELQRCSHSAAELLSEDDWSLCAYELMLLLQHSLAEGDPALEHVRAVLPVCRVSLGIDTQLHHRLAELVMPDGCQAHFPLDVRFRAALLLRSWARAEAPCLGGAEAAAAGAEVALAWARRQLALLRGAVVARALALHREGREAARESGRACLGALRRLDELAARGAWGRAQRGPEPGGRRLLVALLRELEALRPAQGHWCLGTIAAAKVFGHLWAAAVDEDAEDRLSLDAPVVAAALLQGLHPHLTAVPLQVETHALLLAQQLWLSLSAARGPQLPGAALRAAAGLLEDFARWLQGSSCSAAACFARRGAGGECLTAEAAELAARRLLTVELRDGLARALADYRRHLEPDAFAAALSLWMRSHEATRRSEQLVQGTPEAGGAARNWREEDDAFARRMGHWFIWRSVSATAAQALEAFDEPQQIPRGDADAWRRYGPRIKKHLEGLAGAVQCLVDELECEQRFYNRAWEDLGMGGEHLGVTAAALSVAVRPRVEALVESGMWPTAGAAVIEIPAGGGRLVQALETLDRLVRRWPEPLARPTASSLVDILVPHVCAALEESFDTLDRDITSHALDGASERVFLPLKPPTLLHCEGVVTLWRFVHDALDAPLSLGVPVDIVVQPFIVFLKRVLFRASARLVRGRLDSREAFRLAPRAAQVVARLADSEYDAVESDEDLGVSGGESTTTRRASGKKLAGFFRKGAEKAAREEAPGRNVIAEAALLEVEPEVAAPPVQEVSVRLSSLGFCLAEASGLYDRLLAAVNSGDDSGMPTVRHNDARRQICEELPELHDALQERGQALARHLACRLVYFELRQELFGQLYFSAGAAGAAAGAATPHAGACGPETPSSRGPGLTLEAVLARRQDGILFLLGQTPAPLLVAFAVELGVQLTHAWAYVVLDYLEQQRLDQVCPSVDDDQEALKRLCAAMMQEVRRRAGAGAAAGPRLAGLSPEDCLEGQRRLDAAQGLAQMLALKVQSGTAEELCRYAARLRGELQQPEPATPAAAAAPERGRTPRARSPRAAPSAPSRAAARSASPAAGQDAGCSSVQTEMTQCSSPTAANERHERHHKPGWKRTMGGLAKRFRGASSKP